MSKISKVALVCAYSALLIYYLKTTLTARSKDLIEIEYVFRRPGSLKKILKDIKKYGANATIRKLTMDFRKPERLPTDLKYILKWTSPFSHYTSPFLNGQTAFVRNNCKFYNCFMTNDKSLLQDYRLFDAILFDVESNGDDQYILRSPHQYFVFTASESASNFPICDSFYDSYYNLTWTYKLDSDIRWSYITILDKNDMFVGPNISMNWIEPMDPTSENAVRKLVHKKKLVAWFVSYCRTKSKREKLAAKLSEALSKYNLKIDIYGWCGELSCPRERMEECLDLLEQNYYFYLAFENSLDDDYVTEKLLYPLRHYTVPIVFGGANYSRFLPPGSYLDAGVLNATELASKMVEAMKNPAAYQDYFRWHNHYTYKESSITADVCYLCELLNKPPLTQSALKNFRRWWLPNYQTVCAEEEKRFKQRRQDDDGFIQRNGLK